MLDKYFRFLTKKKKFFLFFFVFSLIFSIFFGHHNYNKQHPNLYRVTVKMDRQALFLSKSFVQWSKQTISNVYFNDKMEIDSVEDLDAYINVGKNLQFLIFDIIKRELRYELKMDNFISIEFKEKGSEFYHTLKLKSDQNKYSLKLIKNLYETYLKEKLISELEKINKDARLEVIADNFFSVKISELKTNLIYDYILYAILPFLIIFLLSLSLFYRSIYKKK